jgi:hypothetical protein
MSVRRVSVNPLHRHQAHVCSRVRVIDSPPPPLGGGGGGGVGIEMSDRFDRYSSETKGSARAGRAARHQDKERQLKEEAHCAAAARSAREGATIVHQPPWLV